MNATKATLLLATGLVALPAGAFAVSGGSQAPPAGQAPATAPGGTQGLAGPRNVSDAILNGQTIELPARARQRERRGYDYPPAR